MRQSVSTCSELLLYADDSVIVNSGTCVQTISQTLSKELENVQKWLINNKLSLHVGKTECILFNTKRRLKDHNNLDVHCHDSIIESKDKVKYLGVVLDQDLSGSSVTNLVIGKVNRGLKILYRKAKFLKFNEKKMVCSALLQAHFDYGNNVWYRGLLKTLKTKLQTAQNKMIRYVLDIGARSHIGYECFSRVKWLSVQRRIEYLTLCKMYDIFIGVAPTYLIRQVATKTHQYETRNSICNFALPCVKTNGHNSFLFNGIMLWNKLPFTPPGTKENFKLECKKCLFNEMKTEETNEFVY